MTSVPKSARTEPFDTPPVRPFEARPFTLSLSKGGRAPQDRPESVEGRRHPQDRLVEGQGQQLITLREPQGDRWRSFFAGPYVIAILISLLLLLSGFADAASLEERVI